MTSVKWKERVGGSLVVHIAGAVVEAVPGFVNPSPWPVCPSPDSLSVLTVFLDRHWLGKHWIYWCLQQFCMSDWLFCHWLNHQCWGWQWTFCVAKKEVHVLVTKTPFANFLGWQKSLCGVQCSQKTWNEAIGLVNTATWHKPIKQMPLCNPWWWSRKFWCNEWEQ